MTNKIVALAIASMPALLALPLLLMLTTKVCAQNYSAIPVANCDSSP
jgi:hypothetical protein